MARMMIAFCKGHVPGIQSPSLYQVYEMKTQPYTWQSCLPEALQKISPEADRAGADPLFSFPSEKVIWVQLAHYIGRNDFLPSASIS